jgi:glutamate formiminotransferase
VSEVTGPALLMAVPNVSEGRDLDVIAAIAAAFAPPGSPVVLLDVHHDPDHHRSVFTLAGPPGALAPGLAAGVAEAARRIDLRTPRGLHPHVGAADVVPIVHLDGARRGAACAEALLAGELIAQAACVPVLLYGALAQGRTRADLRRGGVARLTERMAAGETPPDFGPPTPHPSAGATLLAARPPLVAFNLELEPPADLEMAKRIAALIREGGGEGLPGVRAIGLTLPAREDHAQVSCNIENPTMTPLAAVVEAVRRHAKIHVTELIGLLPEAALHGFPADTEIEGFDPEERVIERRLRR